MTQDEWLQFHHQIPPLPKGWKYEVEEADGVKWDYDKKEYVPAECYELTILDPQGEAQGWAMINNVENTAHGSELLTQAANRAYHRMFDDRAMYPSLTKTMELEE